MKVSPSTRGAIKYTEESKQSWVETLSQETWDTIAERINLSSEYPKGTQTAVRHVTYAAHLNKIAEIVRLSSGLRFRTETEIFRVAIHQGMSVLYSIICSNKEKKTRKTRAYFFYEALKDVEKSMERASMISIIKEKIDECANHIKRKNITREAANAELEKLFSTLPEEDKSYIIAFFKAPRTDNVFDINGEIVNELMKL